MILIPAGDEGPRVGEVVRRVRAAVPDVPVVVIANGCTDDTVARSRAAGAHVIESEPGYARALQAGYRHALSHWSSRGGRGWLVQLDADGQHPPEQIPSLVAGLAHADVVIASRLVGGRRPRNWSRPRQLAVRGLSGWSRLVAGLDIADITSGFQAHRAAVVASLAADFPPEVADANVLVRLKREGWRLAELPVDMAPRRGGRSMHGGLRSVAYAVRMGALVAQEARRARRG